MAASLGLRLQATSALLDILRSAACNEKLSKEVRSQAEALAEEQSLPWKSLRPIYTALREERQPQERPLLQEACWGSKLVLPSPAAKEKSPELVARLQELQRHEEERQYNAMVHDVTQAERKADALREGGLVTYKDQLSYGLHVIVVMGVFYAIGHLAAASMSSKTSVKAAGGLLGLVFAMLMESVLLIIRTSESAKKALNEDRQRKAQPFSGTRMPNTRPSQRRVATAAHGTSQNHLDQKHTDTELKKQK